MAKQTAGFMGGFHGRLGPAVGYMWRGQWCVRAYNPAPRNPRTPEQVAHREMFKREVQLASHMSWAINLSFKEVSYNMGMTPYNLFVHLNQHAFSLVERDQSGANQHAFSLVERDQSGANQHAFSLVERDQSGANQHAFSLVERDQSGASQPNEVVNGIFTVDYRNLILSTGPLQEAVYEAPEWTSDNVLTVKLGRSSGDRHDYVRLYVYCPDLETGILTAPVYRKAKQISAMLPDRFAGREVHVYGLVYNDEGVWAETTYVGGLPLTENGEVDGTGLRNGELRELNELDGKGLKNGALNELCEFDSDLHNRPSSPLKEAPPE